MHKPTEIGYDINSYQHILFPKKPYQWSPLKTDRRKVSGSFPGRASRPSRSKFFVVFTETHLNMG